ncbi:MAG: hypothetical protein HMLKMBBP_01229 [Planctomycetes bacterium]|nr:hypothetical protein [Planctomycetota bacterium]
MIRREPRGPEGGGGNEVPPRTRGPGSRRTRPAEQPWLRDRRADGVCLHLFAFPRRRRNIPAAADAGANR